MKQLFIIVIISGLFMQAFSKMAILVHFQVKRDYIAKNLCVQKEKKNNCCKGSCHLAKELAKADKKEQGPGQSQNGKHEFHLFSQSFHTFNLTAPHTLNTVVTTHQVNAPVSVSFSVFHPPRA